MTAKSPSTFYLNIPKQSEWRFGLYITKSGKIAVMAVINSSEKMYLRLTFIYNHQGTHFNQESQNVQKWRTEISSDTHKLSQNMLI